MKSETDLASLLVHHLRAQQGERVVKYHAEVCLGDGTSADLVVLRPDLNLATIYETKNALGVHLLNQCINRQQWADVVVAAVPVAPRSDDRERWVEIFRSYNVGLVAVGTHHVSPLVEIVLDRRPGQDHRVIWTRCNESNVYGGGFAAPGSKDEKRATKANVKLAAVLDLIPADGLRASVVAKHLGISPTRLIKMVAANEIPELAFAVVPYGAPTYIVRAEEHSHA